MKHVISIPFWNKKDLCPPSQTASKKLIHNGRGLVVSRRVTELRNLLSEILTKMEHLRHLRRETVVISRFVYRMVLVFRQYKGFKYIQMLLKTLLNMMSLHINDVITTLRNGCYESSCPPKQMLEWGLVSLMRFSALCHRTYCLSERGGCIIKERFTSGHHWKLAAMCMGILSRVWMLSKYFVVRSCDWYGDLKTHLPKVVATDENWLPADFTLPCDLATWLGNHPYILIPESELKTEDLDASTSDASTSKGKLVCTHDILAAKSPKQTSSRTHDVPNVSHMELNEDVGEVVSRNLPSQSEKGVKRKETAKDDKSTLKKKRKKV